MHGAGDFFSIGFGERFINRQLNAGLQDFLGSGAQRLRIIVTVIGGFFAMRGIRGMIAEKGIMLDGRADIVGTCPNPFGSKGAGEIIGGCPAQNVGLDAKHKKPPRRVPARCGRGQRDPRRIG